MNRFEIVATFYDAAVSGADQETDRSGFSEMLSRVVETGARTILVESPDRFARDLAVPTCRPQYASQARDLQPPGNGKIFPFVWSSRAPRGLAKERPARGVTPGPSGECPEGCKLVTEARERNPGPLACVAQSFGSRPLDRV